VTDTADHQKLRKNRREQWLSSIQEIADLETQRTKWLDPINTNPHWSFIEIVCCYFDDLGLDKSKTGYGGWIDHGLITAAEAAAVTDFHAVVSAYKSPKGDDYDNAAVLNDPKWLRVVEAAKAAQSRLAELITDANERQILLHP